MKARHRCTNGNPKTGRKASLGSWIAITVIATPWSVNRWFRSDSEPVKDHICRWLGSLFICRFLHACIDSFPNPIYHRNGRARTDLFFTLLRHCHVPVSILILVWRHAYDCSIIRKFKLYIFLIKQWKYIAWNYVVYDTSIVSSINLSTFIVVKVKRCGGVILDKQFEKLDRI